jgi:hypothetical protein
MPVCPCCQNQLLLGGRCTVCGPSDGAMCVRKPHCDAVNSGAYMMRRCDLTKGHARKQHYTEGVGSWS